MFIRYFCGSAPTGTTTKSAVTKKRDVQALHWIVHGQVLFRKEQVFRQCFECFGVELEVYMKGVRDGYQVSLALVGLQTDVM